MRDASIYRPNEFLVSPHVASVMPHVLSLSFFHLPVSLLCISICAELRNVGLALRRAAAFRFEPAHIVIAALAAGLLFHTILRWRWNLLLPKERTALWVLLFIQLIVVLHASRASPAVSGGRILLARTWMSRATVTLALFCQLTCLRLDHFKEWRFDAGSDRVFDAFDCVRPFLGNGLSTADIYSHWPHVSVFNFNRAARAKWAYPVLRLELNLEQPPAGRQAYFVNINETRDFLKKEGLTVIYEDALSEAALAVRVPLEKLRDIACPAQLTDTIREWREEQSRR